MRKFWVLLIFLLLIVPSATKGKEADADADGLSDKVEIALGTDPQNADSDGDGFKDGLEVANGYNPLGPKGDRQVKRRAEVNLTKQRLEYFFNGVKIASVPVSTGIRGKDTPQGEFKIERKLPTHRYTGPGYDFPNTKWNLQFAKGFYLHGAYWHNQFGKKPMSHGCVNIAYADAEKLYKFLQVGDTVKVYGKTPAKPLTPVKTAFAP